MLKYELVEVLCFSWNLLKLESNFNDLKWCNMKFWTTSSNKC